ncbi:hypothetical protein, conserved [Eimeria maxima]|uniref:Uncharacterized protein n=1 Tax=Eimeria maxima TaxID=5804 RepID=U6MEA4_EIMMA|nr:hypothetical protein, conserved [Eimeria maxima]CDJ60005.1 hypothetical protein, conserved [Eimeria maxima]
MEVDGEEGPLDEGGGPSGATTQLQRSTGKPPSFFLSKADECFSSFPPNLELAVKFLEKGVSVHPDDVELLQRLAGEYCELGRGDEAKELLQRAIQLEASPLKFLQMAQLEEGAACLSLYRTAISLLESSLASAQSSYVAAASKHGKKSKGPAAAAAAAEAQEIKGTLVRAYCSVAELYLTDLCEEEEAEASATSAVQKALELDPESPDALLCDAQLKKVQDDAEGAIRAAKCLYSTLKRLHKRAMKQMMINAEDESCLFTSPEEEDSDAFVSIETRVNAARLFIDVGMVKPALKVLKACLDENDEDPQVWLVLCCALYKSDDFDSCLSALDELKQRMKRSGIPEDHSMAVHERQLRELSKKALKEQEQQQEVEELEEDEEEDDNDDASSANYSSDDDR